MGARTFTAVLFVGLVLVGSTTAWAATGDLDPSFGEGGIASARESAADLAFLDVTRDGAGRYVAAGVRSDAQDADVLVARFDNNGKLDATFGDGGVVTVDAGGFDLALKVATAPDGSVAVAGLSLDALSFSFTTTVVRLTAAGQPDAAFGDGGVVRIEGASQNSYVSLGGIVVTSSVVVATTTFDPASGANAATSTSQLRRFTATGDPDTTFGNGGTVTLDVHDGQIAALELVGGGLLVGAGDTEGPMLLKTDLNGAPDTTFGDGGVARLPGPTAVVTSIDTTGTGALVVGATSSMGDILVLRTDASGHADTTFGLGGVRAIGPGVARTAAGGGIVGLDGDRVVLVTLDAEDQTARTVVHRLLPDGRRDAGFGTGGRVVLGAPELPEFQAGGTGVVNAQRAVLAGAAMLDADGSSDATLAAVSLSGNPAEPASATVDRVAGTDRIATAIAASHDVFATTGASKDNRPTGRAVVLASATGFADALVGGPLAVGRNGPLLLNGRDHLDDRVGAEIRRVLGPTGDVLVLGGSAALSDQVDLDLNARGYRVTRYAGTDRFDTAHQVADGIAPRGPIAIVLATGRNYPDALSGGAAAAHLGGVVLLTDDAKMPEVTKSYLTEYNDVPVWAIGGAAAKAAPDAIPLAGTDRYATSRIVAERVFLTPAFVGIASGNGFADALSGGAHAGLQHGPLLLTPPATLGADADTYLRANAPFLERVALYGGSTALQPAVQTGTTTATGGH